MPINNKSKVLMSKVYYDIFINHKNIKYSVKVLYISTVSNIYKLHVQYVLDKHVDSSVLL